MRERMALIGVIPAQLANNTTKNTGYIDVTLIGRLVVIINMGATDTTLDFKLRKATDSGGTGVVDVAGAAIVQLSATDDNKVAIIDLDVSKLGDFNFLYGLATIGNGSLGANVSVEIWATDRRYGMAKEANIAALQTAIDV